MTASTYAPALLLALAAAVGVAAESESLKPGDRIWSGVYTTGQAERGKDNFEKSCSNCHNSDLNGSVRAPSLRGDRFMKNWENESANVLFVKLRDSMPATYPETVSNETKIDILAYLLQVNGFPAGKSELKLDPKELDDIQIVQKGEQAAPNFSLVRIVGCLSKSAANKWTLIRTTEPAVIKDDKPTPAALKEAAENTLGTGTFDLLNTVPFKPDSHKGQKAEARGLLYRDSARNALNLTSLETTGTACEN